MVDILCDNGILAAVAFRAPPGGCGGTVRRIDGWLVGTHRSQTDLFQRKSECSDYVMIGVTAQEQPQLTCLGGEEIVCSIANDENF